MTDDEIRDYLIDNGYPEYIAREGRDGLMRRWREFVDQVERGYNFNLEDYRNDLDVRAILQLIGAEPGDLDARFEKMLTARGVRVWESAPGDPFWDFGYPKNAGPELLDDLRAEGLISK